MRGSFTSVSVTPGPRSNQSYEDFTKEPLLQQWLLKAATTPPTATTTTTATGKCQKAGKSCQERKGTGYAEAKLKSSCVRVAAGRVMALVLTLPLTLAMRAPRWIKEDMDGSAFNASSFQKGFSPRAKEQTNEQQHQQQQQLKDCLGALSDYNRNR
ncbi:unnamed protein product [Polarella glacialis]|uniref:Uncharacterized protein n=1 Tax=Polarella glacialis TaxID=89957 RepID=A0A813HC70_POLGL|nr:unnamed protein product [Polarella glacialis]